MKSTDPADYQHVPRPVAAMANDFAAGHRVPSHSHPRAQLIFAASGVMEIIAGGDTWVVPDRRAVWVPAGIEHTIFMIGRVAMRTLYVDPAADAGLPVRCEVLEVSDLLRALILTAMEMPVEYEVDGRDGLIMRLILHELRTVDVVPLHAPMPRDARLRTICQAIVDDPGRGDTLAQWGGVAGATSRTLANRFRAETDLTFGRWRQQARLVEAARRLAVGQSVSVVAQDLGYLAAKAPSSPCSAAPWAQHRRATSIGDADPIVVHIIFI